MISSKYEGQDDNIFYRDMTGRGSANYLIESIRLPQSPNLTQTPH